MRIEEKKVVSLTYRLVVDGQVKDEAKKENPLEFIFGVGSLLPKFEEYIKGKEVGDSFEFTLSPEEGYGKSDPSAIVDLPLKIFEQDGKVRTDILFVGNVIPMMNQAGGIMQGKVVSVDKETVKMDFNHELADKVLNFTGEITAVRNATDKELEEGLHGELAHNCGGNCSSCNGGCH
ncbi:MAG: FKBP-type peptidyl-prolyl cis-trans isomerase [Bacteroidales bacterium]|nr:FKBP-type peptidyl-prolyl cis-trans isomerase [Bacteroidales bacterium]